MTDLMNRLHRLGDRDGSHVLDATVRRDVLRGRGALLRRRARRAAACLSFVAIAGVGFASITSTDPDENITPTARPSHHAAAGVRLVAYTGEQQPGFIVTRVPSGFVLQGSTEYSLEVAKGGDTSDLSDYRGKLVVMLQSPDSGKPSGGPVTVGQHAGWLRHSEGNQILTYNDGEHLVVVQAWGSLGLSDAQVVEFAEGVTVTAQAQAARG